MTDLRNELADVLRGRVLRAIQGGTLAHGDRLPSARELETEFSIDHRVVLDAYRILAEEGLVELRPRGGIYVTAAAGAGAVGLAAETWLVEMLAQGLSREIPVTELHEWVHDAALTLRLRAVAVQETADQVEGMRRELEDQYGLEATGLHPADLTADGARAELRYADLLVTTPALEAQVRPVTERLGKTLIVVDIRQDLIAGEWRLLLRRPFWVLVGDDQFVGVLERFFANTPGSENLRLLVAGRDDLGVIPEDASVYVTRNARLKLGDSPVPGRVVPSARLFSPESSLSLIRFIVSANLAAMTRVRPG
ncbi:hypothetical protein BH23GEM9_BH23GEM9_30160 [soil metagenome]